MTFQEKTADWLTMDDIFASAAAADVSGLPVVIQVKDGLFVPCALRIGSMDGVKVLAIRTDKEIISERVIDESTGAG